MKLINKSFSFGLIWKALFAVTISTLLASGSILVLGQYTYNTHYQQKVENRHQQYKQAFASVLTQLKHKETELSWWIPALIDTDIPAENVLPNVVRLIDKNWFKIGLESDIRSIYLFNIAGQLEGAWGEDVPAQAFYFKWLENAIKREQPQNKIVCDLDCFQYHALPFLHNGKLAGIFVFVSSINEIVLQMKAITRADVGILVHVNSFAEEDQQVILPLWSSRVTALTDSSKNQPVLEALQKHYPDSIPEKSISFVLATNIYNIFTIPFGDRSYPARLIIIDNVTHDILDKQKAIGLYVISGLSSILLSGVILFLLFVRPTTKLKRIINLLPLIAEKKYSLVLQTLPKVTSKRLFTDEIDVLDAAAHNLIHTLTGLDHEVEKRSQRLFERSKELQSERNFVSNILNTAQVIIMRLDQSGNILSINKYGETLTGYDLASLGNKHLFTDLIYDNESHDLFNEVIPDLLNEKINSYQHDCTFYSLEGIKLYVSLFFTVIHNPDTDLEILVVGLDLTERRSVETKLAWLADHDPLTHLFNRRHFERELHRVLLEAERFNHEGALLFFDIDQFKYVNDSSGHQTGDRLLLKIAEKLREAVRSTDLIARFGGDEFVVLAPQIDQNGAVSLINKIFNLIKDVEILLGETVHKVTVSAGLLMFPVDGYTEQDLMSSVDIAMYKAKESGRGRWCMASLDDLNRTDVIQRVNWKAKIERALADDRFTLYFQPIMSIVDKQVLHYECLLRMIDENGDVIPPGFFIGVAEQTGLIRAIDKKVLEMAFQHQKIFTSQGLNILLSVNISGDLISNPDAFAICTTLLEEYGVKAEQFIFEVTETQAVTNLLSANNFIIQFTEIGGKFALDDFGVGFSSMNYLKKLPVQYLKIDGEFIKNIANSHVDRLFVKAINEVGLGMNIQTIAEFVENDEILQILAEIGVDYAQGYGIGKPMAYPEFHQVKK